MFRQQVFLTARFQRRTLAGCGALDATQQGEQDALAACVFCCACLRPLLFKNLAVYPQNYLFYRDLAAGFCNCHLGQL